MKKISRFLIVIVFLMFLLTGLPSTAKTIGDEFDDLTFEAKLKLVDSEKTTCEITWKTDKEIKYLNLIVVLPNKFEQNPYNSTRENVAAVYSSKYMNGYYLNTLVFDVYYYQIGNLKARFEYSYDYIIEENSDDILICDYVFVTGVYWVEKQPIYVAVLVGAVITIFTCIVTYVVIENSRRSILLEPTDEIEDENEEIDEVSVPKRRRKVKKGDE